MIYLTLYFNEININYIILIILYLFIQALNYFINIYDTDKVISSNIILPSNNKNLPSNNKKLPSNNKNLSNNFNSFDFWDTLGGRICFSNYELFNLIEKRLNIKNFAKERIRSEQILSKNKTVSYDLEDIYNYLYNNIVTDLSLEELLNYEYLIENEMLFLIPENINKLDKNTIIVSDFFYKKNRFLKLLSQNNILIDSDKVFIENYGKYKGTIWDKIKYKVISHTGDNKWSDNNHPIYKKLNITTNYFNSTLNTYENIMINYKYKYMAFIMRSVRLSNPYNLNTESWILWNFYSNHYLPILFLKILILKFLYPLKKTKLVFMSRDCYFLFIIYKTLFPKYECDYLYISRVAMKNADDEYIDYVKNKVNNSVVIDLLGSGKSFYKFTQKYNIHFKHYHLFFNHTFMHNNLEFISDMNMYSCISYMHKYIERLNYSFHGSFIKFSDGKIVTKIKEYDDRLYEPIYKIVNIFSKYLFKIKDVIIDYQLDEKKIDEFILNYLGRRNCVYDSIEMFTPFERNVLNKINHKSSHECNDRIIKTNIDYNEILNLEKII